MEHTEGIKTQTPMYDSRLATMFREHTGPVRSNTMEVDTSLSYFIWDQRMLDTELMGLIIATETTDILGNIQIQDSSLLQEVPQRLQMYVV